MENLSWTEFIDIIEILRDMSKDGWTVIKFQGYKLELHHKNYGTYTFSNPVQLVNFLNRWDFEYE